MLTCIDEEWKPSIKTALDAATNLLSVVGQHVYFPTFSNGLKDVAGFLGYHWTDPDASGLQSIVWREQWETGHDEAVKCRLLRYNHEDCMALWHVTGFIASIVTESTPEKPRASQPDKVVYTTEMRPAILRKHKFGKSNFCLPDLEFVNRCAYFDYQRDKVYLRDKATSGMATLRRASKRRRRPKVNKRAQISCKRCPTCASKRLSQGPPLSLRMIDMKFLASGGVKKWVTLYSSWRYLLQRFERATGISGTAQLESALGMPVKQHDDDLREEIVRLLNRAGENGLSASRIAQLIRQAVKHSDELQEQLGVSYDFHRDSVNEVCASLEQQNRVFHNGKRNKGSRWIHIRYRES